LQSFKKICIFVFTIYLIAMTDQFILLQLQQMPDNLKHEVLDFISGKIITA